MKHANLERIDRVKFESLDTDQQTRVVGGDVTKLPTVGQTLPNHTVDVTLDFRGDLPTG